ncbi:hypothetical protein AB6A40_011486, partial [Gnathostoma spinigerum]
MSPSVLCFVAALCILPPCEAFFKDLQNITVKGRLACETKSVSHATIELWEEDRGIQLDDHLNTTTPDSLGNFRIYGEETETT